MAKKKFQNIQNETTQQNCISGSKDFSKVTKIESDSNKKHQQLTQSPSQFVESSENLLFCSICYQSEKSDQKVIKKPCNCKVMVHKSCLQTSLSRASKQGNVQQKRYKCNKCYKYYEVEIQAQYDFDFQKACSFKSKIIYHYIACFLITLGEIGLIVYLSKLVEENRLQSKTNNNQISGINNSNGSFTKGSENNSQSNGLISNREIETIVVIIILLLSIGLLTLIFNLFKNHLIVVKKKISFINLTKRSESRSSSSTQAPQSQKKKLETIKIQT